MATDIVFPCPQCAQWLESPPDLAGLFVECPKCEAIIKVPAAHEVSAIINPGKPVTPAPETPRNDEKGSTIRIDLPPNLGIPQATPKRRFILRRPS
ncbi:MAG TPA: hypothetical protein PKE26_10645 [Kiritimatiellia bacterium]|nr:hypothetical protein [Kiritimatiellia bacterium]HMO99556.1 hypothetical protein [Kiritimatiellia bacterium]HMP97450.1 hypothetical protein [Kiritimatiellia bacterium]